MLQCLNCKAKITLDTETCAACGTKIDADGNGVPDALEKMVEEKARALIASEKQREANDQAQTRRDEEASAKAKERKEDETELEWLKLKQKEDENEPRRSWYLSKGWAIFFAACALVIGGIIFPACAEPISGRSFIAGKVFCPGVCPTCRGPGRIFTWHETSASYEGNVSRQLCHNDVVDIDKMQWTDSDKEEYAAYRLTLWSSVPVDWALVFGVFGVFGPFLVARMRNKFYRDEVESRGAKIVALERKLKPTGTSSNEPYR